MIVIARNFGQLGNRLLLSANLIAAAREYDVPVLNPSFVAYAKYFRSTHADLWCQYPIQPSERDAPSMWRRELLYRSVYLTGRTLSHLRMTRFPLHVIRMTGQQHCDLQSEAFASKARSGRPVLVSGWQFTAGELLQKHADAIRDFYRILPVHQNAVDQTITEARRRGDYVVGVHVRQGDYAKFRGGRYFYSLVQYSRAMRRIQERVPHRKVVFVVCGNIPMVEQDFGGLNVVMGTGNMIEDMYTFAATDMLMGPPSTYTGWASFYGKVPFRWMESPDESFETVDPPYGITTEREPVPFAA